MLDYMDMSGNTQGNHDFYEERETFPNARAFLNRVKDLSRKAALLEGRIALRTDDIFEDGSYGTVMGKQLRRELEDTQADLKVATIQVTDLIGRLTDITHQLVMTKRYVDDKSWDAIAEDLDIGRRQVLRAHGKALPVLERILVNEGQ